MLWGLGFELGSMWIDLFLLFFSLFLVSLFWGTCNENINCMFFYSFFFSFGLGRHVFINRVLGFSF